MRPWRQHRAHLIIRGGVQARGRLEHALEEAAVLVVRRYLHALPHARELVARLGQLRLALRAHARQLLEARIQRREDALGQRDLRRGVAGVRRRGAAAG